MAQESDGLRRGSRRRRGFANEARLRSRRRASPQVDPAAATGPRGPGGHAGQRDRSAAGVYRPVDSHGRGLGRLLPRLGFAVGPSSRRGRPGSVREFQEGEPGCHCLAGIHSQLPEERPAAQVQRELRNRMAGLPAQARVRRHGRPPDRQGSGDRGSQSREGPPRLRGHRAADQSGPHSGGGHEVPDQPPPDSRHATALGARAARRPARVPG